MKLAVSYTIFALLATVINLGTQDLALWFYDGKHKIAASIMVGTAAGLLLKYSLDKRYIFRFHPRGWGHDSLTFMTYTLMGGATTAIFWGFELAFDYVFQTKQLRYLGGAIGLAIGYWIKYQLDKRYVFRAREA